MNRVCSTLLTLVTLSAFVFSYAPQAQAIVKGELADFTGGNNGWRHGQGSWPLLSGGQDGPTDDFLSIQSQGGGGALSRMIALNTSPEWTGDFTAAGISTVNVDVLNENGQALDVRFSVDGGGGRFATNSISVPSSSEWQSLSFSFDPSNFQSAGGGNIADTLSSVFEIRVLHNPSASWLGAPINATLGVDNILAIPEPSSLAIFTLAGLSVTAVRRRR
ncbi:MAG: PEP-CTERM sorting domain-containing protein [Lacipirellulaceae bacterium]